MEKKRIEELVKECATQVIEYTGQKMDVDSLRVRIDDGDFRNDSDVEKMMEMMKRPRKCYDWRDRLQEYMPSGLLKSAADWLSLKLTSGAFAMKVDDGKTVSIHPLYANEKEGVLKSLLYHELTHIADIQTYGDRRFELIESVVQTEEKLIAKKHSEGFFRGYIRPTHEIKALEQEIKDMTKVISNYAVVFESHAVYMADLCIQKANIKPLDRMSWNMMKQGLMNLPLMVFPAFRKKIKQYTDGRKLVEMQHMNEGEWGISLGTVYNNPPTADEIKNPEGYFKRLRGQAPSFEYKSNSANKPAATSTPA